MSSDDNPFPGKELDPSKVRSYGRPDSDPVAPPQVVKQVQDSNVECPNCGCKQIYEIHVMVKQQLIRGGVGKGMYLGCPACPWASPMAIVPAEDVVKPNRN